MQPDIKSKLLVYQDLLEKWQKSVNLVAPSTLSQAWERHFMDSYQLVSHLPESIKNVVDLGSGAGFPGLVIAIARPNLSVHLIESDSKKAAFLSTVSRETGTTNVTVHNGRVESVLPALPTDVITARALAPLSELLALTASHKEALLIFPKGEEWRKELDLARSGQDLEVSVIPSKTDKKAAILCITQVSPKSNA